MRNWLIGWHIAEYEQGGSDRAAYGEQLLPELARRLRGTRGASVQQLYRFRDFYRTYPAILSTVSRELQRAGIVSKLPPLGTSETVLTSDQANLPGIASEVLLSRRSFSHFLELLPLDNALQLAFWVLFQDTVGEFVLKPLSEELMSRKRPDGLG